MPQPSDPRPPEYPMRRAARLLQASGQLRHAPGAVGPLWSRQASAWPTTLRHRVRALVRGQGSAQWWQLWEWCMMAHRWVSKYTTAKEVA